MLLGVELFGASTPDTAPEADTANAFDIFPLLALFGYANPNWGAVQQLLQGSLRGNSGAVANRADRTKGGQQRLRSVDPAGITSKASERDEGTPPHPTPPPPY
jgi:hypothetical protein